MSLVRQRACGLAPELPHRLNGHLSSSNLLPRGASITVALSGGLDSVVLLDLLLSLRRDWNWTLTAAHFDHGMRARSSEEAEWVRSLCAREQLGCRVERAEVPPENEAEARHSRYDFLLRVRHELGATWLATAHQADDQVETVLFRLLRGSGLPGLAGIPARRAPRIVRPLLPFWRHELAAYADKRGLPYLRDPSNRDVRISRNRLRHEIIPFLEAGGHPAIRRQLRLLGELAGRASEVMGRQVAEAADGLIGEASEDRLVVARTKLLAYDKHVRAHLLRELAARVGPRPGRAGTCTALKFISTGSSGGSIDLAGGLVIRREFDRFVIERRPRDPVADGEIVVNDVSSGAGSLRIAGVRWLVRWRIGGVEERRGDSELVACFDPTGLQFPLTVRGWRPGDRIQRVAGTRKLKKVFVDRKVGRSQRSAFPLLTDRSGVLWIGGLERSSRANARRGQEGFWVSFRREP